MSGEEECGSQGSSPSPPGASPTPSTSTTTVSSVAVQAGGSRVLVAILKSGTSVQLQLAESVPNVLEIGSSQDETKKLLQDHEQLLAKLKTLEDNVWDLLCEADKVADENRDQSQVYDAMAATLSEAWAALIHVLEKRKELLSLTSEFFDNALEFAVSIDQADDFLQNTQDFENAESLRKLLQQHHQHTKVLLERSLALLNKSRELTEFIEEFKSCWPAINSEIIQGARNSCLKIDNLLELLQDRRRQLDKQLRLQCQGLEQVLLIGQWHQEEDKVTSWFKKGIEEYLQKGLLGSSLTESEELLREYREYYSQAKEWSAKLDNLKEEAGRILSSEDYADKDNLQSSNEKLAALQDHFWQLMDEQKALLQETNDFFNSANKAFDKLGSIEAYLKLLNAEGLSLPVLASKHAELQNEIKNCVADALDKGEALVSKESLGSRVTGIQEMIGYIQKRVEQLTNQCPAHKEQSLKNQQLIESLEVHLNKVSALVQTISAELARSTEAAADAGTSLSQCEEVLHKYMELARQAMEASHELEAAVRLIDEVESADASELAVFARKASLLHKELGAFNQSITANLEALTVYVGFLKSAKELGDQMQSLKDLYRFEPAEDDSDTAVKTMLEAADSQWQSVLKNILSVQDKGQDCLNLVKTQVNSKSVLKEPQAQFIEKTINEVKKEKEEMTELWTSWQRQIIQVTSVKHQWRKLKDQLKQTTQGLKNLEEDLLPTSGDGFGGNNQPLSQLQEKCNKIKPVFQQLNAEVEYTVKLSELLSLKGAPERERCKKTSELVQLHQRVKDKMKEYDDIHNKISTFHQVRQELESLVRAKDLVSHEPQKLPEDTHEAKTHLSHTQEKQAHMRHLYTLVLQLGADITSIVQHSKHFNVPLKDLKEQLAKLEQDTNTWTAQAAKYEEELSINLQHCTVMEEIQELKESFKDLKKKFNNLKFNYSKKTEKAKNSKVLKNHIQQVELLPEKIQSLKKKMDNMERKVSAQSISQPSDKDVAAQQSMSELQTHMSEFTRGVEEYKKNLDMTENLQQLMEECNFWCEEASATVVRVGKYSAECKTKEAVQILDTQFKKFVNPTAAQQEERIQQINTLATSVYGADEGVKYIEKTIAKHKEALNAVNELYSYLKELEDKLERERSSTPQFGCSNQKSSNVEKDRLDNSSSETVIEKVENSKQMEQRILQEISVNFSVTEDVNADLLPCAKDGTGVTEGGDLPNELSAEENPSGDEYECISPDDISLPPLSETPESNLPQSETEQEEQPSYSSQGLHVSSYSTQIQINTGSKRVMEQSELSMPFAFPDTSDNKREKTSTYVESFYSPPLGLHPKYRIESPTIRHVPAASEPSTASHARSGTPKSNAIFSMRSEVHEAHSHHHTVQKSMREVPKHMHASNTCTNSIDRLYTSPDVFSGRVFQSDLPRSSPRPMVFQEELKSASEQTNATSLSGQSPNFSKLLSNATVKEGSPVTLEVEVTGYPEPTLTWYKKGHKLSSDDHLTLLQKETKHSIYIQKVCVEDGGFYVARATNSSGFVSCGAVLCVKVDGPIKIIGWFPLLVLVLIIFLIQQLLSQ